VLVVHTKLTLVLDPILLDHGPVLVVEGFLQFDDLFVVQSAVPMELVVFPVAVISYFIIWIVQSALAVHLVFIPLADVLAALSVVKCAVSMS
jgi:hypothetical protein